MWTIVPAPVAPLLLFSVIVPELAPHFAIAFALVTIAALALLRGRTRIAASALSGLALVLVLGPLFALPGTIAASDRALHETTGRDVARGETADALPFDIARELGGSPPHAPLPVERDLPVVTSDGARLGLDVYRTAHAGPRPAVILIYGGAWQFGSRSNMAPLAHAFAALGYTAIAIDYRHAPAYRFPTQRDDVRAALATIAKNARAWGVDPERVATLGESAGAELALLAAYEPGPLHVRAAVAFYSPFDLAEGYARPPRPDPVNVRAILTAYLGAPPASAAAAYAAASPRSFVRPGLPPTLLMGGDRDELCKIVFQREMHAALRAAGDRVASLEFPWSNHGFAALSDGLGGQLGRYYAERFLAETIER
jgi:acetyl esterase/lipase